MPRSVNEQTYAPMTNGANNAYNADPVPTLERIQAKTAAYSVLENEFGTTFTTRGATASVTFTLPAVTNMVAGMWYRFFNVSAYGMVIASNGSSDNIVALNDAAADTITCTTTSRMIGANVLVIFDGTGWLAIEGAGATYTVA